MVDDENTGDGGMGSEEEANAFYYEPDDEFLTYGEHEGPNGAVMIELIDKGQLQLAEGENMFLYTKRPPLPPSTSWDRIEGMMLGLAIGDALGKGSEGDLPSDRAREFGEIRDYIRLNDRAIGDGRGYASDDTQLAFWTLEQMIEDRGFNPEHVADKFCSSGKIYGIGSAVRAFLHARKDQKKPWYECGQPSAGNGALMRIAPMLIPHLKSSSPDLWADVVLSTAVTHNDRAAIATSIAFVNMFWRLLRMDAPPNPIWWLKSYTWVARDLEGDTNYEPRGGKWAGKYRGPLWGFVQERVSEAHQRGLSVLEAGRSWYSGAYLMETVPSVLYILMKYGHDPEEAIVRAVNDTKDNDTIAAIVGAAVGALHGKSKLPERWVSKLSGRTSEDDDGKVFRLLEEARNTWWIRVRDDGDAGQRPGGDSAGRRSLEHFAGCLLGGAVGDALGAPVEFMSLGQIRKQFGQQSVTDYTPAYGRDGGAITDDTQMTLFTVEGLIRADNRWKDRGICNPAMVLHHSYLRWLGTQEELPAGVLADVKESWLLRVPGLHARRAPGNTCLSALRSGKMGSPEEPINDSKGCGGVMRVASVGLIESDPFRLGCEAAAITHGHPSGYLAAGFFASVIGHLLQGRDLEASIAAARDALVLWPQHEGCLRAIDEAQQLANEAPGTAETVESIGAGWVAEEALSIALFCALKAKSFEHGVMLAVNHSGDSDSTGSMTGNILGLLYGKSAIPQRWLDNLELRDVIEEIATDLWRHLGGDGDEAIDDWEKYPGW